MSLPRTVLRTQAQTLLDVASTALGSTVPARAYITHAETPFESCDQLTVQLMAVRPAVQRNRTNSDPTRGPVRITAQYRVSILRSCWPSGDNQGNPADAAILQTASTDLLLDVAKITFAYVEAASAGTLLDDDGCDSVVIGGAEPIIVQGGVAGWRIDVNVGLG